MSDDVKDLLVALYEYMEQRADIKDGDETSGPLPNEEMRLMHRIQEELAEVGVSV